MKGNLRCFCVVNTFCISLWFDQPKRFPPSAFNDTKAGPKFDWNCRTAVKGHFGYLHMKCINPVIVWIPWSGHCWTLWLHYLVLSSQSYSLSLYAAVFLSLAKVLSPSGFPTQSAVFPLLCLLNSTHPTPPILTLPSAIQIQIWSARPWPLEAILTYYWSTTTTHVVRISIAAMMARCVRWRWAGILFWKEEQHVTSDSLSEIL